jgi:hypothetical protein
MAYGFFMFLRLIFLDAFNERFERFLGPAKRVKPDREAAYECRPATLPT